MILNVVVPELLAAEIRRRHCRVPTENNIVGTRHCRLLYIIPVQPELISFLETGKMPVPQRTNSIAYRNGTKL